MKINTLNTLSQNNPAFGVRIPINEINISGLKQRQRLIANPQLDKPAGEKVLDTICDKIIKTKQENSSLISFLQTAISQTKKIKYLLEQSGKTLERAFWETCNKFFDVQLVANDKDKNIDNISDDKIKEDSYLTKIFHPIKNIEENKKPTIEYCIKNYSKAKKNRKKFCEEVKKKLNPDMKATTILASIVGPILRLPEHYNDCKNAIQKEEPTFTEFKEYLKEKAPKDNKKFYNSGNGELLAYTIETFKKYVPKFKEEFVFAEETQANNNSTIANTIGKKTIKKISKEQSFKDAVAFINYYIGDNIINQKLTAKSIHSALFDTNIESNPNENHVSLITVQKWKFTINKIKETLEQYPNKTNEEIKNDIRNKCYSNSNYILTKKELFFRAINKLRALNKTTNDITVEKNDDTTQTKTNTRASIKRTHELDSSELKAMDNTEKNNDVPLQTDEFRNDNIIELVSADSEETTNDNIVETSDTDSDYVDNHSVKINSDTLQTKINTRASIKRMHMSLTLQNQKQ